MPEGSELVEATAGAETEDASDGPYTVLCHRIVVGPGAHQTVTFTYRLPDGVAPDGRYHLTWLRQPGTPADRLTVTVGGRSFSADPAVRFEVDALLRGGASGSGGGRKIHRTRYADFFIRGFFARELDPRLPR